MQFPVDIVQHRASRRQSRCRSTRARVQYDPIGTSSDDDQFFSAEESDHEEEETITTITSIVLKSAVVVLFVQVMPLIFPMRTEREDADAHLLLRIVDVQTVVIVLPAAIVVVMMLSFIMLLM